MVSNFCFLTWIQISQEAGQVVWYSHVFNNFPQFVVINTVKGFGVVSKAEVGVFLELSCFFWWSNRCWQFDLWLFSLVQFSHLVMSNSLWPHGVHMLCLHVHYLLPEFTQTHVHWVGDASNQLILCCPLLLPPSIFPCIRVFSNEPVLHSRWPKYWSFSFSISPSNEHPGLISFRMDRLDLFAGQGTLKSLLQHHSSKASILGCSAFFVVQLSHPYMTTDKKHSFD